MYGGQLSWEQGLHYVDIVPAVASCSERGYRLRWPCEQRPGPSIRCPRRSPQVSGDIARHLAYWRPGAGGAGLSCTGTLGPAHFVKMVYNGIEYGIMAAFAEGLNILELADAGIEAGEHSAEASQWRS